MKSAGQIMLVAVLLAGVRGWAGDLAMAENPYAAVVERNIFGLMPIPTNAPASDVPPAEPPPKITPNGIMSIFGKLQVLFKVPGKPKPGQPPKEESYVMGEGERQDEIEVTKIDEAGGLVTFNNHGTVQELALANAPNISAPATPAGGAGGSGFARPGVVPGSSGTGGSGFGGGSGRFGRSRNAPGGSPDTGSPPSFGGAAPGGNNAPMMHENLSPEAQVIMIEKNRLDTQEMVDKGLMPPLPPTVITPTEATAFGGSPLIANPGGVPPGPGQ